MKTRSPAAIPELDVRGKKKDHPSINDYYKAASSLDKPIQYQHGLSNYSNVKLGDDRISFKKSLSQDVYSPSIKKRGKAESLQTDKSYEQRKQDYAEANEMVGLNKIHEMEQMMRDKLQQRTKTGPFQLRKTFKYFDRDGSGGIDFSEFQRAMELMGFQFNEIQQLALFARYDESCTGDVVYNDFVEKVMESDFKSIEEFNNVVSSVFSQHEIEGEDDGHEECSEEEKEERQRQQLKEVKKCFDLVDGDRSGFVDKKEFSKILMILGKEIRKQDVDKCFRKIDTDMSGHIEFNEFYDWYKSAGH